MTNDSPSLLFGRSHDQTPKDQGGTVIDDHVWMIDRNNKFKKRRLQNVK